MGLLLLSHPGNAQTVNLWGFEKVGDWNVQSPDSEYSNDAYNVALSTTYVSQGQRSLKLVIDRTRKKDLAQVKWNLSMKPANLSGYQELVVDIYSEMYLFLRAGLHDKKWAHYEKGPMITIRKGWNRDVHINLADYKPSMLTDVYQLTFEFSGYNQSGGVYLDHLRGVKIDPLTVKNREADAGNPGHRKGNLARLAKATASTVESGDWKADYVLDGDTTTRWSSIYSDDNWIQLDFQHPTTFNQIVIQWQTAFGEDYDLLVSNDAKQWKKIYAMRQGRGGSETIITERQTARYLKLQGITRGTPWGYSIIEMEVYDTPGLKPMFNRSKEAKFRLKPVLNYHPQEFRVNSGNEPPVIKQVTVASSTVACYDKQEFTLEMTGSWTNPYDPEQIDLMATLMSPSGKTIRVPGFYYWPFTRQQTENHEQLTPGDKPQWKVRFTPTEPGAWKYSMQAVSKFGEAKSSEGTFTVIPGTRKGFVQLSRKNPDYFEYQNGELYFPIGLNMCWYPSLDINEQTYAYDRWLEKLSTNGGNYIRLWMFPIGFCPEWRDTGLGDYDLRQPNLWRLDHVFEKCSQENIQVMLSLLNHGQFSSVVNPEWASNPYNKKNGGMLSKPSEFITHPLSRKYFLQRLRYLAARYGYSTNLLCYEYFNEIDWVDGMSGPELVPWMQACKSTIQKYDPNPRLFTNSARFMGNEFIFDSTAVDFTQVHKYHDRNWAPAIKGFIPTMKKDYSRPVMLGEFGLELPDIGEDPEGVHLRTGNWASVMSGACGGAMVWWWESYVEPMNLFPAYKGISKFLQGETLNRESMRPTNAFKVSKAELEIYAMKDDRRALGWIKRDDYSIAGALRYRVNNQPYPPTEDASLTMDGIHQIINIEWWDTETGSIIKTDSISPGAAQTQVKIPVFTKDIAFKMQWDSKENSLLERNDHVAK